MKKIITLLVTALMLVSMSLTAFADMGPPTFIEYDVYVSNPNGITITEKDDNDEDVTIKIPYNAKLTVLNENSEENTLWIRYNNSSYSIPDKDVSKVVPKVDKKDYKMSRTFEKIIINKDGAVLRNGPATSYETIGKIPYGVTVKSNYGIYDGSYKAIWLCVTYEGCTGWLHCVGYGINTDCASVYTGKDNEIEVIGNGYYLYSGPASDKKVTGEIPKNTKFKFNYFYEDRANRYYVEYNGVKGWLKAETELNDSISCIYPCDVGIYTAGQVKIYSSKPSKGKPTGEIGTIPAGEILCASKEVRHIVEYYEEMYSWYYINYNGKEGWVRTEDDGNLVVISYRESTKINSSRTMYSKPNKSSSKICEIPKGSVISSFNMYSEKTDGFNLVKYNGKFGWAKENEKDEWLEGDYDFKFSDYYNNKEKGILITSTTKRSSSNATNSVADTPTDITNTSTTTTTAITEDVMNESELEIIEAPSISPTRKEINTANAEKASPKFIIICCVCAAVILAITAVVLIKYIKKKKETDNSDNDLREE